LWTEDDDNLLRSMAVAGKSITLMTVKLGPSHQGYQIKSPGIATSRFPAEDKNTKRLVG